LENLIWPFCTHTAAYECKKVMEKIPSRDNPTLKAKGQIFLICAANGKFRGR